MGSNGKPTPHGLTNITAFGLSLQVAPGTGGGCVYSGPFSNYTVNLGPLAFAPFDGHNGLDYNPRCLTRDLSLAWSNQTKPTDVTSVISSCADLGCFDTVFEALDGVHAGGHFTIGGLGLDAFASTGDPAFYLHHAQVDRVWTIWQNLKAQDRTRQVYGTSTAFNGEFPFGMFHIRWIADADGSDVTSATKSERNLGHRDQFRRPCTSAASGQSGVVD